MGKIVLLDELTINQIAAGEVIERPASVVKEMVENSIDAGAKNIVIEIRKGGIDLIKVTDDGSGISEDDMEIAFERHATSKIRSSSDLETVTTMGFRGEALASIAAIARVEMISKTANDENGHKIVVEGGDVKEKSEIGCQKGTTITVENLFYNTPVRYKFLRKDYTEAGYIEDAVTRIALVNKGVAIKLINSGKTVIQTSGNNDTKSVIYSVYGKDVANGIIEVESEYEGIKVKGVVGKPEIARGNRGYQLFFVNGRYVKDKTLTSAVDGAYKNLLPVGKYGFLVLNIEMDPKMVDVNVHPAKLEVRFENESLIYKAVYHAIKSGLENVSVISSSENKVFSVEEKRNYEPDFKSSTLNINDKFPTSKTYEIRKEIEIKNSETLPKKEIEVKEEPVIDATSNKDNNVASNNYADIAPEENMVQPKLRGGFSDLLKKVMGNGENKREEYVEPTLVEALFEARNGKKRATPFWEEENDSSVNTTDASVKKVETTNSVKENIEKETEATSFGFVKETYDDENIMQKLKENTFNNDSTQEIKLAFREENSILANNTNNKNEKSLNDSELIQNEKEVEKKDETEELNGGEENNQPENNENKIEDYKKNIITETEEEIQKVAEAEDVIEEDADSDKTVQIGNVKISSDTEELSENINDFLRRGKLQEEKSNVEENIKTSVQNDFEELKQTENNNLLELENGEVGPEISAEKKDEIDDIAESIVKSKIEKTIEPTQILDMNKIRENISDIEEKDEKEITPEFAEMYKKTFGKDISKRPEEKIDNLESYNDFLYSDAKENLNMFDYENNYVPERKFRYIGRVFECYLIIEMNSEMYIIDQRLAYERIIYDKLRESYYDENCRDSQILLLPDIVALNKKQILIANENIEMFEKAGFGFEDFGENTLKLYAVPGLCEKLNTKKLFLEILDGLDSVSIISKEEKEEKFISTIAYKSAEKAKLNLDDNEIKDVLNQLLSLKDPFVCSDEKQIAIKMSKIDFEKKFSRR